jgi:hypothetical protein
MTLSLIFVSHNHGQRTSSSRLPRFFVVLTRSPHFQPPRAQPKVFCLSVRTHKLSIMITVPQEEAIAKLKEEVLSALTALYLHGDRVPQVPAAKTVDDFELCRAVKEKGKPTGKYELLDHASGRVKDHLVNWDSVYIRFRDESGTCSTPTSFPHHAEPHLNACFVQEICNLWKLKFPFSWKDDEEEPVPCSIIVQGEEKGS